MMLNSERCVLLLKFNDFSCLLELRSSLLFSVLEESVSFLVESSSLRPLESVRSG